MVNFFECPFYDTESGGQPPACNWRKSAGITLPASRGYEKTDERNGVALYETAQGFPAMVALDPTKIKVSDPRVSAKVMAWVDSHY